MVISASRWEHFYRLLSTPFWTLVLSPHTPEVAIRALEWTAHRHGAGGPRFDYQGWVWLIDPVKVPVGHSLPRSTMRAASAYSGSLKRVGMMVLRLGSHAARALLLAEE